MTVSLQTQKRLQIAEDVYVEASCNRSLACSDTGLAETCLVLNFCQLSHVNKIDEKASREEDSVFFWSRFRRHFVTKIDVAFWSSVILLPSAYFLSLLITLVEPGRAIV